MPEGCLCGNTIAGERCDLRAMKAKMATGLMGQ